MKVHRITLTLEEPTTIGSGASVSNEMRTRQVIPATALRGALYDELRLAGLGVHASAWFGPQGPRWSDAWPESCVPLPRSFMKVKRDEGFAGFGAWNALSSQPPPDRNEQGEPLVWQSLDHPWLQVGSGMPRGSDRTRSRIDMHVSLNYASQSARGAALFSRETLETNCVYYSYVSSLQPLQGRASIRDIAIGKRHSVNGRIRVDFSETAESLFDYQRVQDNMGTAYIQLMSPALIPGRRGGWLRGLDPESFLDLGLQVAEVRGFSSFADIVGWNGLWKLPKEQCVGIAAGSCWRIVAEPAALNQWLDSIERDGLGARPHEGFGWVAVNPPWLGPATLNRRIQHSEPPGPSRTAQPRPWPGFTQSDWPGLVGLDRFASELAARWKAGRSRPVYQALSLIRRAGANGPGIPRREKETEDKPWSELQGALTDGRWPDGARQQAFLLSAVLVKLRAMEEKLSGERS